MAGIRGKHVLQGTPVAKWQQVLRDIPAWHCLGYEALAFRSKYFPEEIKKKKKEDSLTAFMTVLKKRSQKILPNQLNNLVQYKLSAMINEEEAKKKRKEGKSDWTGKHSEEQISELLPTGRCMYCSRLDAINLQAGCNGYPS